MLEFASSLQPTFVVFVVFYFFGIKFLKNAHIIIIYKWMMPLLLREIWPFRKSVAFISKKRHNAPRF